MKFKEFLNEEKISYEDWKKLSIEMNSKVDDADKILKSVAGDNKGGLVPDDILKSKEYQDAKKVYSLAFKALQTFNKNSPKEFMRKASKEYRLRSF